MVINKANVPNATSVTEISLAAPFAFKGGSYPGTGGTCTTTISGTCTIVVTFTPTSGGVKNDFVTLQYNNGTSVVSVSRAITATGVVLVATKIKVTGPGGVTTNQCIPYTITSTTDSGQQANVAANITVNLVVNNGTGTFYSNNTCATTATSTIISTGTSSKIIYFKTTTASQNLTLVFNPTATLEGTTKNVATSGGPTKLSSTPPAEFEINTCNPVEIYLVDASGIKAGKSTATTVNLTENGNVIYYSDSLCTGVITSTVIPTTIETTTVYVKNASIQTVTLTAAATGLTSDTSSVDFVSSLTWWNTAYAKRIPITIDNSDQATAHTNIQVLVRLNSSRINYSDILSGGADIRFTLDDHTTTLSYDIESWNTSGESLVWVRIPTMAASSQRIIYMYYNNPLASDGQSASATWNGFSGIWNMDKTGANYYDATASGKNGVPVGTVTDTTGPVGPAIYVNGSSGIDTNYDLSTIIGSTSTVSFWIRSNQAGSNTVWQAPGLTGVEESGGGNDIFFGFIQGDGTMGVASGNGQNAESDFIVNDDNWRFITMTRLESSGAVQFYVNGVLNGTGNSDRGLKDTYFDSFGFIADTGGASQFLVGYLDGIRVNNSILPAARIRAEYKYSVESHISYGTVENL
jgi:hypothetical protein